MRSFPPSRHGTIWNEGLCVYCGEPAAEWDHFVPKKYRPDHIQNVMLASCFECNRIVGARIFKTFIEKQQFIQEKLRLRYRDNSRRLSWENNQNPSHALLATIRLHLGVFGNDSALGSVKKSLKLKKEKKPLNSCGKNESPPCEICGSTLKRKRYRKRFCSSTCEDYFNEE